MRRNNLHVETKIVNLSHCSLKYDRTVIGRGDRQWKMEFIL